MITDGLLIVVEIKQIRSHNAQLLNYSIEMLGIWMSYIIFGNVFSELLLILGDECKMSILFHCFLFDIFSCDIELVELNTFATQLFWSAYQFKIG